MTTTAAVAEASPVLARLAAWLVARSREVPALPELWAGFCAELVAAGLPLARASLGLETLHPEESGSMLRWQAGEVEASPSTRAGILSSPSYLLSPTRLVDETGRPFRWRRGEDVRGMPLLAELAKAGITDYLMLPLPFLDTTRTAVISFATAAPGGFLPGQIADLDAAARLLSPWAERRVLRRIAVDLLAAYLGPEAGRRVYAGQIERGDVRTIKAAIWFCDLRGFTTLSDSMPRARLVALLNRWFEAIGVAIGAADGEVLKFLGDGLLAVFAVEDDARGTCERALVAAEAALARTDQLNAALAAEGEAPLRFGLALHLGEVEFGNIGTRERLDFTVIGPAVNLASRIEGLTKQLGLPLLASEAFAAAMVRPMRDLGTFPVRGLGEPVRVLAPLPS